MEQRQTRFPASVKQFVKDMLSVNPKASIYDIMPMFEKYYHHQRNVVERATSFSSRLNGSEDDKKLRMAIQIYNQSVVQRVFDASPPL